ncbi:hypothetical protein MMYC01_208026 [Madurella mycetomatis]|uniref:Uncharacterized protein n=1 Tax=Madurella mycetomatis TaxID=100816 RepID=A0A175VUD1_9PEZI|nr:hypothetical protein MMYC01_208026 [Madurella mycetomatis]
MLDLAPHYRSPKKYGSEVITPTLAHATPDAPSLWTMSARPAASRHLYAPPGRGMGPDEHNPGSRRISVDGTVVSFAHGICGCGSPGSCSGISVTRLVFFALSAFILREP